MSVHDPVMFFFYIPTLLTVGTFLVWIWMNDNDKLKP